MKKLFTFLGIAALTVLLMAQITNAPRATTSAELAVVLSDEDGTGLVVYDTSPTLTTPTIAGATLSGTLTVAGAGPAITPSGGTASYPAMTAGCSYTEAGDNGYTCTVEVPAGAVVHDICVVSTVLWDDTTAASMIIGDDDDPNGWFVAIDLKATELLVGEAICAGDDNTWGGQDGAYLNSTTGQRGRTTAGVDSGWYYGAASEVIFLVSTTDDDGTAGRSFSWVTYSVPTMVAATGG